jgi:hypothetical protein
MIDVTSGKIGAVVQEQQIVDLPINGRNPMMFLPAGRHEPARQPRGQQQWVVSTGCTNASNVKIDGVWANDASSTPRRRSRSERSARAVGEYRVTTSRPRRFDIAARRAGQRRLQIGDKRFHGSVYEFNRNTGIQRRRVLREPAELAKTKFIRNQFGAAFVRSSKQMFFFAPGKVETDPRSIQNFSFTQPLR